MITTQQWGRTFHTPSMVLGLIFEYNAGRRPPAFHTKVFA